MPQTTHTQVFEKLDNNEKLTVAHIINMAKPDSDLIELQRGIIEDQLTPIEKEKTLDHLHKIADGYMGIEVRFGTGKKVQGVKREKLVENSINFTL